GGERRGRFALNGTLLMGKTGWSIVGGSSLALALVPYLSLAGAPPDPPPPALTLPPPPAEATTEQVHQICGACHLSPPADTFPTSAWRREVKQGYEFLGNSSLRLDFPPLESLALYY